MKGSTTIEMAYIMPVVFLVFTVAIYSTFYLYDKNILYGVAYEATVIGTNQYGTADGIDVEELEVFIQEKCTDTLLYFSVPSIEIEIDEEGIEIELYAQKGQMAIRAVQSMPLVYPEAYIRKIEIVKGV